MDDRLDLTWCEAFGNAWKLCGFHSGPIAHVMRANPKHNWVRFYSFDDKRWPETHSDEEQAFERFRSVAEVVAEDANTVYFVHAYFSGEEDEDGEPIFDWDVRETSWRVFDWRQIVFGVSWEQRKDFYGLFFADKGRFISPYDGGMDVFLETTEMRGRIKKQFSGWLSPRDDGL